MQIAILKSTNSTSNLYVHWRPLQCIGKSHLLSESAQKVKIITVTSSVSPWTPPVFCTSCSCTRKSSWAPCTRGSSRCAPPWCTWGGFWGTRAGHTQVHPQCTRTGSSSGRGRIARRVCRRSRCRPRSLSHGSRRTARRWCCARPRRPCSPRERGRLKTRRRSRLAGACSSLPGDGPSCATPGLEHSEQSGID